MVKPAAPEAVPVAAKKAVAKLAAPKPVTSAKAPTAKKAVAKKVFAPMPAKAAQPPKPAPAPQVATAAKILARVQKGFIKMGSKAPQKVKPFLRHVDALLGNDSSSKQIDAMVAKLAAAGSAWFIGDEVIYGNKSLRLRFEVADCDFKFNGKLLYK